MFGRRLRTSPSSPSVSRSASDFVFSRKASLRGLVYERSLGPDLAATMPGLQRKTMSVSSPSDALEREADQAADAVMRGGHAETSGAADAGDLQRKCAACEDDERAAPVQRKTLGAPSSHSGGGGALVAHAIAGGGAPLSPSVRAALEPRFGRDFSTIRVHTGPAANAAAAALDARAFTVGRDVVFGARQYAPQTIAGRTLLAHELAHVVQQSRAGAATKPAATIMRQSSGTPQLNLVPHSSPGQDCAAVGSAPFDRQPADLQAVVQRSFGLEASSWFNTLGKDRTTLAVIYNRLCRFGLWPFVKTIRGLAPGERKFLGVFEPPGSAASVAFSTDDSRGLLAAALNSFQFCTDIGAGASQHPGQISLREVTASDSLHVAVGPGSSFDAHIDRYSPVKGGAGTACEYEPTNTAAHIGRELVPPKVRGATGIPGVQVFPEQAVTGTNAGGEGPSPTPSVVGLTLRF